MAQSPGEQAQRIRVAAAAQRYDLVSHMMQLKWDNDREDKTVRSLCETFDKLLSMPDLRAVALEMIRRGRLRHITKTQVKTLSRQKLCAAISADIAGLKDMPILQNLPDDWKEEVDTVAGRDNIEIPDYAMDAIMHEFVPKPVRVLRSNTIYSQSSLDSLFGSGRTPRDVYQARDPGLLLSGYPLKLYQADAPEDPSDPEPDVRMRITKDMIYVDPMLRKSVDDWVISNTGLSIGDFERLVTEKKLAAVAAKEKRKADMTPEEKAQQDLIDIKEDPLTLHLYDALHNETATTIVSMRWSIGRIMREMIHLGWHVYSYSQNGGKLITLSSVDLDNVTTFNRVDVTKVFAEPGVMVFQFGDPPQRSHTIYEGRIGDDDRVRSDWIGVMMIGRAQELNDIGTAPLATRWYRVAGKKVHIRFRALSHEAWKPLPPHTTVYIYNREPYLSSDFPDGAIYQAVEDAEAEAEEDNENELKRMEEKEEEQKHILRLRLYDGMHNELQHMNVTDSLSKSQIIEHLILRGWDPVRYSVDGMTTLPVSWSDQPFDMTDQAEKVIMFFNETNRPSLRWHSVYLGKIGRRGDVIPSTVILYATVQLRNLQELNQPEIVNRPPLVDQYPVEQRIYSVGVQGAEVPPPRDGIASSHPDVWNPLPADAVIYIYVYPGEEESKEEKKEREEKHPVVLHIVVPEHKVIDDTVLVHPSDIPLNEQVTLALYDGAHLLLRTAIVPISWTKHQIRNYVINVLRWESADLGKYSADGQTVHDMSLDFYRSDERFTMNELWDDAIMIINDTHVPAFTWHAVFLSRVDADGIRSTVPYGKVQLRNLQQLNQPIPSYRIQLHDNAAEESLITDDYPLDVRMYVVTESDGDDVALRPSDPEVWKRIPTDAVITIYNRSVLYNDDLHDEVKDAKGDEEDTEEEKTVYQRALERLAFDRLGSESKEEEEHEQEEEEENDEKEEKEVEEKDELRLTLYDGRHNELEAKTVPARWSRQRILSHIIALGWDPESYSSDATTTKPIPVNLWGDETFEMTDPDEPDIMFFREINRPPLMWHSVYLGQLDSRGTLIHSTLIPYGKVLIHNIQELNQPIAVDRFEQKIFPITSLADEYPLEHRLYSIGVDGVAPSSGSVVAASLVIWKPLPADAVIYIYKSAQS